MRRAGVQALLCVVVLTALAVWPGAAAAADDPPHADDRVNRVAAALGKSPLFVDPDVGNALDESERDRVERAIGVTARRLGVPAYVVVIPNPTDSESQGRAEPFLFAVQERAKRDGLYVMVDSRGYMESEAFRVPRRYRYSMLDEEENGPGSWKPADTKRPFEGLAERITERLNAYAAAPPASPTMPTLYSTPEPFGEENTFTASDPEIQAPFFTGLLLAGPIAAPLLYWLGLGVLALLGIRGAPRDRRRVLRHNWTGTKPGMRRLRRQGARELERLRRLLATADAEGGRPYAVSAYDAAQILYDDAKDDENRAIDLVGAIVLARQGCIALFRDTASPPPPCVVNPLHGESTVRRHVPKVDGRLPRPCPLCAACGELDKRGGLTVANLLRVPGPGGRRPHTAVPGVWRDEAWGAAGTKFLPRVMRYLGVD
ncbi:hypothetical protein E1281_06835 [Actinomadura sp. KC345]|uniref:hypothetical protein n=1 Tax=Actinomadura sp. KC345 TaxID=2530371 RepID=UPI00104F121D|nr:hypothetical protein [Actinomadura sp. KC345]TDC56567.1 hypothetical protein E1281_06835 [Actinomadura sp. KC345]